MFEFLELEETVGKAWHRLVGSTASMPHHAEHAVTFEEMKPILATCFRGFGGETMAQLGPAHAVTARHRLRLRQLVGLGEEKLAHATRDDGAVRMPPMIGLFPDRHLNRDLYLWLAAIFPWIGRRPPDTDPLRADLARLDRAERAVATVINQLPGFQERYAALCRGLLAVRRRGSLPVVEQLVENRITNMLCRGAGLPERCPPAIFPKRAPAGYQPMLAVPLWPDFEARAEIATPDRDDQVETGANRAKGDGAILRAEREKTGEMRDRSPFILNRFEKILAMSEMVEVDRAVDNDPDQNDAARDLEEIRLGQRKQRPSSRFRFDLDLPPELAETSALNAELTYPEWNYRRNAYDQAACRVVAGIARSTLDTPVSSDETRALTRQVRRQFEALRPKRETLRAQLEGEDLDLDAVVRMQAELAAGVAGEGRIHLLSRPQTHDLAVTLLVDVSLSTDAWFDDRRVLDVSRDAVNVLSHGLSACGTNFSVLTFTSRRRDWVRVETVKDFGEGFAVQVQQRLAGLKPGYYTRMGAAIRHSTAMLARQPNEKRLLILLTDGKPNDVDHYEGRFALEDTRHAVMEARRAGTSVFAVTVDKDARSYLPRLFGRHGFSMIGDISRLPRALPRIYRELTR